MSNLDLVHAFATAIETGDRDRLADCLAPEFSYQDQNAAAPLDRDAFLDFCLNLKEGLPDLALHITRLQAGNPVRGARRITGTHSGPLHIPPFTDHPIHATGRKVYLPEESTSWTVHNGRITLHSVAAKVGGGPSGLLAQLGGPLAVH